MTRKINILLFIFLLSLGTSFAGNPVDSLKVIVKNAHDAGKVDALLSLAKYLRAEHPADATPYFEEAMAEAKKLSYTKGYFMAFIGLGKNYLLLNNPEKALSIFEEAHAATKKKNDPEWIFQSAKALAEYYQERVPEKALAYAREVRHAADETGKPVLQGAGEKVIAEAYFYQDNYKRAAEHFEKARELYVKGNEKKNVVGMTMNLGVIYFRMDQYDLSIKNYKEALKAFRELKDDENAANTLTNIGISERSMGRLKDSKMHLEEAYRLYLVGRDTSRLAMCLENMASTEESLGNAAKSLELILQSVKLYEAIASTELEQAYNYSNLGAFLRDIRQYTQSRKYLQKAIAAFKKSGSNDRLASAYASYAALVDDEGKTDSAIYYSEQALQMSIADKNEGNISINYTNLGSFYLKKNDRKKALDYFNKALAIKQKINDRQTTPSLLSKIGQIYFDEGNYKQAFSYYQQSVNLYEEAGIGEDIYDAYARLAVCYNSMGDYKNAYKYQALSSHMKDSLMNTTVTSQLAEMSEKYESEKKQKEISDLTNEGKVKSLELEKKQGDLKRQRVVLILSVAALLVFMILSVLIFRALRQNQRSRKEIAKQKELIEEKQKEIVDSISYAKRLQEAILPPEKLITSHLPGAFVLYEPKDIVAGDFYWFEKIGNAIYIAAADCTGHGVPGAMVSVVCSNALNRSVLEFGLSEPGQILDKTRQLVLETFARSDSDVKDGMDISLAKIEFMRSAAAKELHKGKLVIPRGSSFSDLADANGTYHVAWSGANNPLWYFKDGAYAEIKAHKQPIGKTDDPAPFPTHKIELQKGDSLYLVTDGFADQFGGPKGKKFKYKQLIELISTNIDRAPEEQKQALLTSLESWKGQLEQVDDVTLIGIRL